jgi:hypothetical protein
MFRYLRHRPDPAETTPFWRRLGEQAQIQAVTIDGGFQRFIVSVPYWSFMVRLYLRHDQVKFAFLHMIDERIKAEIVEPSGVPEETLVLWRKRVEEGHAVQRKLLGRWDVSILEWHRVRHS